jgi:hypothetical protein
MRSRSWSLVAALLLLAASRPAAAAEPPAPAGGQVAALVGRTNEERRAALLEMLRHRKIPFRVEAFRAAEALGGGGATGEALEGRNVVVTVGEGEREIVVGAHYDAVVLGGGSIGPGAVDNAAAVATLVRLAESLRARAAERPFAHRLRIVFFDLEERGLHGSRHDVAAHGPEGMAAAVNVDVVGYGDTLIFGEAAGPRLTRVLLETCAARRLPCLGFSAFPPGDDRSFRAAGVPNVSVALLPRAEAHQFWLFLNARDGSGLAEGFRPPILEILHSSRDTLDKVEPAAQELAHDFLLDYVTALDAELAGAGHQGGSSR